MAQKNFQPAAWLSRDRFRFPISLQTGVAGGLVAFTLACALISGDPDGFHFFITLGSAAAGVVCGLCFSGWFGRPGPGGWVFAVLAALLSVPLAGAVAGTLVAPGTGTLLGAYLALHSFVYLKSFAVWLLCLVILHLQTLYLRRKFPALQPPSV